MRRVGSGAATESPRKGYTGTRGRVMLNTGSDAAYAVDDLSALPIKRAVLTDLLRVRDRKRLGAKETDRPVPERCGEDRAIGREAQQPDFLFVACG